MGAVANLFLLCLHTGDNPGGMAGRGSVELHGHRGFYRMPGGVEGVGGW